MTEDLFKNIDFNEILEHLTEGEGRGFLGRSMYDAIFDKIHALITENQQLKEKNNEYRRLGFKYLSEKKHELQNKIDKAINNIDILQEIIYQQPTNNKEDDFWLSDRLDGIKNTLKGDNNE